MTKYFKLSIIFFIIATLVVFSCTQNKEKVLLNDKTKYDQPAKIDSDGSTYLIEDHCNLIEILENTAEKDSVITEVINSGVNVGLLNIDVVRKLCFDNTDVVMYSIGYIGNEDKAIIIYKYAALYHTVESELYSIGDGLTQHELKSLEGETIFALQMDAENRVGNINIFGNDQLDDYSGTVYDLRGGGSVADACCRQEKNWSECMQCSLMFCAQSWGCAAVFALAAKEVLAAMAISCIGAGPNAKC